MKTYCLQDAPLRVSGVPLYEKTGKLQRLPDLVIKKLPHLKNLALRCPGGRVSFRTDSPRFTVRVVLKSIRVDIGMSIYAAQSARVTLGAGSHIRDLGIVNPPNYQTHCFEKSFEKAPQMEQITVWFPRNEPIEAIEIDLEDDAVVLAPEAYHYDKPVVFYGSSITEGGCSCNTNCSYNAILSQWLDFDYYNLGFSGNAKGEPEMAEFISTLDMCAFVYDYDHNAPNAEHLKATHQPFFQKLRQAQPLLPVLIMTQPAQVYSQDMIDRREIIKATYEAALAAGDRNVYFLDGETFYGNRDRHLCTIDDCHPNDLGFYRMATVIRPVLEQMLGYA